MYIILNMIYIYIYIYIYICVIMRRCELRGAGQRSAAPAAAGILFARRIHYII